jgi:hypothetical protein
MVMGSPALRLGQAHVGRAVFLAPLLQGSQLAITVPVARAALRHCFGKLSLSGIRCSKPLRSRE